MARYKVKSGGGWPAIGYAYRMAKRAGGIRKLYKSLKSPNTCKTCAVGMGGISGGMVNEAGQGLQICKKSMQAQAHDMLAGIPAEFFERNPVSHLAKLSGRELEGLGRLVHPLFLSENATHFDVLTWPQALDKLVERWRKAIPDRSFFYASGRSSMEAAFLIQLLARQWGTNNVNNCSYYCHQASGVGLGQSLGGGTSTVTLEDLRKCDLVVLIGANPASNHPRLMRFLLDLRRRGGKVVVVNPFREIGLLRFSVPSDLRSLLLGSEISNLYLQPHCGGDMALLKAAAVLLWRAGNADVAFLAAHCNQAEAFKKDLEQSDLQSLVDRSGVSMAEIESFSRYLAESNNTIFAWAMGITHQEQGVENVRWISNLALMRGMVGKPGAGLLPIRGHSNVQGVGSVGVAPKLKPGMAAALLKHLNVKTPESAGMDTFSCMQAAHAGEIDFALLLGGNLYAANPDLKWAAEALGNIRFTASLSTTMNLGHIHGHGKDMLILPVRARDEERQSTAQESMFNYVRLSRGGEPAPAEELPTESEIFVHIAQQLFGDGPVPWPELASHRTIREFIARTVPNLQPMAELHRGKEFTIPGRIKHTPDFNTENGKANLLVVDPPDTRPPDGQFNLMTFRSEGQFNTIIYEDEDLYRGVEHRRVVFMNEEEIRDRGFSEGEQVWVESAIGRMQVELVAGPIRAGNIAMYYPEANQIVPRKLDSQSRTPVFKRVCVKVTSSTETPVAQSTEIASAV